MGVETASEGYVQLVAGVTPRRVARRQLPTRGIVPRDLAAVETNLGGSLRRNERLIAMAARLILEGYAEKTGWNLDSMFEMDATAQQEAAVSS